jgi:ketosteroid isomerase-like protein
MSQENVESLRAFLTTWSREPWTLAAWQSGEPIDMSFFDPEVVYEDTILPDHVGDAYRGRDGVIRAARRWIEGNEWLLVEFEEIVGTGDRLVSLQRARGKGRYSGIEMDTRFAYAWTFREGRVVHFQSFLDPDDAREAAGLRE